MDEYDQEFLAAKAKIMSDPELMKLNAEFNGLGIIRFIEFIIAAVLVIWGFATDRIVLAVVVAIASTILTTIINGRRQTIQATQLIRMQELGLI